jgi:hypothetical protein
MIPVKTLRSIAELCQQSSTQAVDIYAELHPAGIDIMGVLGDLVVRCQIDWEVLASDPLAGNVALGHIIERLNREAA